MEINSTSDAQLASESQTRQPSSPEFGDPELIGRLTARNVTAAAVQLGKQLAKPSLVEQSPSAGFIFARPSSTVLLANRKVGSQENGQNEKDPTSTSTNTASITNETSQTKGDGRTRSSQKILDLGATRIESSRQVASTVPPVSSATALPSTADIPRRSTSATSVASTSQPVESLRALHALAAQVDFTTQLKVLAFSHQKDVKQHKEVVKDWKAVVENKNTELTKLVVKLEDAEQYIDKLNHHVRSVEQENELLNQRLKAVPQTSPAELEIVDYLKDLGSKLDVLCKEKRKENHDADELAKANTLIRQMADDLRQYRAQIAQELSKKASQVDASISPIQDKSKSPLQMVNVNHQSPLSIQLSQLRAHNKLQLSSSPTKKRPELGRLNEDTILARKEESQELPYIGGCREESDVGDQEPTELPDDIEQESAIAVANSAIRRTSFTNTTTIVAAQNEFVRTSENKFGKRSYTEISGGSEDAIDDRSIKKPLLTQTPKLTSNHQSGSSKQLLIESDPNILTRSSSKLNGKPKSSRGQGGL